MSKSKQLVIKALSHENDLKIKATRITKWLKSGLNIDVQINKDKASDQKVKEVAQILEQEVHSKAIQQETKYGRRLLFKSTPTNDDVKAGTTVQEKYTKVYETNTSDDLDIIEGNADDIVENLKRNIRDTAIKKSKT